MELTEKQFKSVIKKAFIYGICYAPFFPEPLSDGKGILNEGEQLEKLAEIIEDCRQDLKEQRNERRRIG